MANLAEKLGLDEKVYELKLGSSFDGGQPVAYHSIRYDFKPASVDTSQIASVDVGENSSVTVTLPHVEGAGTAHTVYKGNKRQCQKECVLVIDHNTGEITLEKLASNIQLKKTRIEGSSKAMQHPRPHTPTEKPQKTSPSKKVKAVSTALQPQTLSAAHTHQAAPSAAHTHQAAPSAAHMHQAAPSAPHTHQAPLKKDRDFKESSPAAVVGLMSCSDSDSDNDSVRTPAPRVSHPCLASGTKADYNVLNDDLNLSDSSSSDSD